MKLTISFSKSPTADISLTADLILSAMVWGFSFGTIVVLCVCTWKKGISGNMDTSCTTFHEGRCCTLLFFTRPFVPKEGFFRRDEGRDKFKLAGLFDIIVIDGLGMEAVVVGADELKSLFIEFSIFMINPRMRLFKFCTFAKYKRWTTWIAGLRCWLELNMSGLCDGDWSCLSFDSWLNPVYCNGPVFSSTIHF